MLPSPAVLYKIVLLCAVCKSHLAPLTREAVKKSPTYCPDPQIVASGVAKGPKSRHVARYTPRFWTLCALLATLGQSCYNRASPRSGDFFTASEVKTRSKCSFTSM